MQRQQCNIKKDDKVKIIAGKDRGKIGKVLRVNRKKERLIVENVNMMKKHVKPNMQNRQGGIVETEAPIHWSNVMVVCNKCISPARIKHQVLDDGKKVRKCSKCSEIIDA